MAKPKCPKCLSRKIKETNWVEINHEYGEKTEFVIGTRAVARRKKVLISYDRVTTYKCSTCGHQFDETKKIIKN